MKGKGLKKIKFTETNVYINGACEIKQGNYIIWLYPLEKMIEVPCRLICCVFTSLYEINSSLFGPNLSLYAFNLRHFSLPLLSEFRVFIGVLKAALQISYRALLPALLGNPYPISAVLYCCFRCCKKERTRRGLFLTGNRHLW